MTNATIVIAGAGPTGLMLAAELALAGAKAVLVEPRATQDLPGQRAGGLHARSIEVLDQRGVVDRFLAEGKPTQAAGYAMIPLDLADQPTRHGYVLALPQERIERTLLAWVEQLGVTVVRGVEVTDFVQDEAGVDVRLSNGASLRAAFLVGCDGGRSVIRKRAGIEFAGVDASVSYLIAEGSMTTAPPVGIRHGARGVQALGKIADDRIRMVLAEPELRHGDAPSVDELRAALVAIYGDDFGLRDVTWASRFSDMARQAVSYRAGRVLLAGDAAHVHSPTGGQGLNLGLQDAVNLGWKLAQVVAGTAPATLLDSYHAERHPVGARVIEHNLAQTALLRGDDRTAALRRTMAELLATDALRLRMGAMMAGLDIAYHDDGEHPLLGRRVPDLDLVTADGVTRVFTLLHDARGLLLDFGGELDATPWADRVRRVEARHDGAWVLPVVGAVAQPQAVLVRPDGHVAWVGDGSDDGLRAALTRWFGARGLG
ncbi:MAG: FAD-dependent monooxygenase [Deltaproteobacteria bacterium]|nr:FAD-dependent monooxygenase [Deltaproteobacteria bacterium]